MPTRPLHVALDEAQFRRLVAGEVVSIKAGDQQQVEVQCILSDIGWPVILRAVRDGIAPEPGHPKGPPDPPQAREFLPNQFTRRPPE
jgi:hypothetical protein